ncbi:hypothetical protein Tco_1406692 [Tanacetum coccineum]
MHIALERSKTQQHSSHAVVSVQDEVNLMSPQGLLVDADNQDDVSQEYDEQDDDNQDDDDQEHDDQDDEEQYDVNELTDSDNDGDDFVHPKLSTHDEEDKEKEDSNPRVHTPSNYEFTDDEESDEEKRDIEMTDAPCTIVQTTQVIEDTHVIITPVNPEAQQQSSSVSSGFVSNLLNPNPYIGIDSIFNLNTESTSLIDFLVTTIVEPPLLSTITLPPPPTPLITHLQQTPIPTLATTLSSSLQDLPNFGSLFGLRDEAQVENANFINKLDDNIKKIIKDQVKEQVKAQVSKILPKIKKTVNEQLEAKILTRSSSESKTSHAVATNLSELELKKILIDKMESNKSIHRSDEQKNIYKALVDAYKSDKLILDTYGETASFKRQSTSAPKEKTSKTTGKSTKGSKSNQKSADESAQAEELMQTAKDLIEDPRESFNELMDTPLDFSAFVMNRLKVDTLTPELLAGPTFELMKGSCKSLVELKYFFEEVYKATTDQLDWNNPEGQQYPHDLLKPLPLIPNSRGRRVIPFDHFINNDLAYLSGDVSSQTYTTSVTKTKAADYGHIKWIEDLIPNTMWSQVPVSYDKHALWGISHWGQKQQKFYGFAANRESTRDDVDKPVFTFQESVFIKQACIKDIEHAALLVQGS